jgi:hypothetical protein
MVILTSLQDKNEHRTVCTQFEPVVFTRYMGPGTGTRYQVPILHALIISITAED